MDQWYSTIQYSTVQYSLSLLTIGNLSGVWLVNSKDMVGRGVSREEGIMVVEQKKITFSPVTALNTKKIYTLVYEAKTYDLHIYLEL